MPTLSQAIRYRQPLSSVARSMKQDFKQHGILGMIKKRRSQETEDERGAIGLGKSIVKRGKSIIGLKQTSKIKDKIDRILHGGKSQSQSADEFGTIRQTADQSEATEYGTIR